MSHNRGCRQSRQGRGTICWPVRCDVTPSEHLGIVTGAPRVDTCSAVGARVRQNWVLDPVQDMLFIIAAPVLSLGLTLWLMQRYGAAQGGALVILIHVVLTVAHHMPTFIRIYGDTDLFRRFKWSFVIGPVIPLLFSAGVLTYINVHQYPVEYFLYLYIFLALWDPWHFLRQHFGFMRIYDRHNAAPARLASNMDWAICTLWFVHIMIASADWIPGLLEDLYRNAHIPLLLALPDGLMSQLQALSWWLAVAVTIVYVIYLVWCVRQGFFVSPAKLVLLVCTFGVMYLTYTPNDLILQLAPAWSFKVGFATVGIVHMTQYLAIVWRYDQRIAQQGRARRGWFEWLHARRSRLGVLLAAVAYVAFCIAYGDVITQSWDNRWLMSVMLAIGFTSTLMHYYFDGFIWKVRHQQNRVALDMQDATQRTVTESASTGSGSSGAALQDAAQSAQSAQSWWSNSDSTHAMTATRMFTRQLLYFGLPMGILTLGALSVWNADRINYVQRMYQAQRFSQQGNASAAADAARAAYATMQKQLPVARKLAELRPSAAHEAELAFLIYNESLYEHQIMPALAGRAATQAQQLQHRQNVREAADWLLRAVYRGGDLAHPGREKLTSDEASEVALSWQRQGS